MTLAVEHQDEGHSEMLINRRAGLADEHQGGRQKRHGHCLGDWTTHQTLHDDDLHATQANVHDDFPELEKTTHSWVRYYERHCVGTRTCYSPTVEDVLDL